MKKIFYITFFIFFTFFSINSSFAAVSAVANRAKSAHPDWGFKNFNTSRTIVLSSMTEGALKAAIAKGGTIKIPAGTINFSSQILLNNNTKLIGAGMGKTILSYRGSGADGVIRLSGHTNVVLQDFTLDGNHTLPKTHGIGVIGSPSHNFLFKGVEVKNFGPKAKGHEKFDISETSGIMIGYNGGDHFTIDGCRIMDVAQHSIGLHDSPTAYGIVKNNYMKGSFMGIDISSNTNHIEVFNNEITDCLFGGKFAWAKNSSFHDNYIHNLYYYEYLDGSNPQKDATTGFAYQGTGNDVEIYNNIFYGNFKHLVNGWSGSATVRNNKKINQPLKPGTGPSINPGNGNNNGGGISPGNGNNIGGILGILRQELLRYTSGGKPFGSAIVKYLENLVLLNKNNKTVLIKLRQAFVSEILKIANDKQVSKNIKKQSLIVFLYGFYLLEDFLINGNISSGGNGQNSTLVRSNNNSINQGGNGQSSSLLSSNNPTGKCSFYNPCKEGDFCRIKTGQCFPLVHKDRGFRGFAKSGRVIKASCSGSDVQVKINSAGKGDTILIPACSLSGIIKINKNYVVLKGSGMGKTKLNGYIQANGHHIIVSDLTINAKGYIGGVDGYANTGGNLLFERIEAYGAGRAGDLKITQYPYNTIRYSKLSNSLHGIANKMANKSQIYSNEAFNNSNYGMDSSTVDKVEIAGNYFHNNSEAGAKTPNAKELHYHHNDMNNNGKAGIVYYRDGSNSGSEFGKDTTAQKGEVILEYNDLTGNPIGFNGTWAQNTLPQMNYLILKYNKMNGFTCKKCGRIEIWGNNGKIDQPFGTEGQTIIKH